MPNRSCTIILNGHGYRDPQNALNFLIKNINYNLIFLCSLGKVVTVEHHNTVIVLLLQNIMSCLGVLERLPTTTIVRNPFRFTEGAGAQQDFTVQEHKLSNAYDVLFGGTIMQGITLHLLDAARFSKYTVIPITTNNSVKNWWHSHGFTVEFDSDMAKQTICDAYTNNGNPSTLLCFSENTLIYIHPTTPNPTELSLFVDEILPKLRISASFHPSNGSTELLPYVYFDDRNNQIENERELRIAHPEILSDDAGYHELSISGDANIIWDSCRA